jgi:hypothetical protein
MQKSPRTSNPATLGVLRDLRESPWQPVFTPEMLCQQPSGKLKSKCDDVMI